MPKSKLERNEFLISYVLFATLILSTIVGSWSSFKLYTTKLKNASIDFSLKNFVTNSKFIIFIITCLLLVVWSLFLVDTREKQLIYVEEQKLIQDPKYELSIVDDKIDSLNVSIMCYSLLIISTVIGSYSLLKSQAGDSWKLFKNFIQWILRKQTLNGLLTITFIIAWTLPLINSIKKKSIEWSKRRSLKRGNQELELTKEEVASIINENEFGYVYLILLLISSIIGIVNYVIPVFIALLIKGFPENNCLQSIRENELIKGWTEHPELKGVAASRFVLSLVLLVIVIIRLIIAIEKRNTSRNETVDEVIDNTVI